MVVSVVLLVLRALGAVLGAAMRRLVRGPLVAGWGWGVELRRAAFRAAVESAMRSPRLRQWSDVEIEAPLPWRLRSRIQVDRAVVGGVPGEWLRPRAADPDAPVLLYFHGGGYVVGHPSTERPFIVRVADAVRARCFSVDYRLAPRHPFPAAVDDAFDVYRGLLDEGVDPSRLVVVGDSAGGGLAAALVLRLLDEGARPPAGAVLFSPWLDLTLSGATIETNAATDYLPRPAGRAVSLYLGDADPRSRYVSPVFADLTGLPPMLVLAGGVEMLLADSTRFAARAVEAGVDVTLHIEADMYHVWPAVLPRHPTTRRTIDLVAAWVRSLVGAAGSAGIPGAAR